MREDVVFKMKTILFWDEDVRSTYAAKSKVRRKNERKKKLLRDFELEMQLHFFNWKKFNTFVRTSVKDKDYSAQCYTAF